MTQAKITVRGADVLHLLHEQVHLQHQDDAPEDETEEAEQEAFGSGADNLGADVAGLVGDPGGASGAGGAWEAVQVSFDCPDGQAQESYELSNNAPNTGRAFITNGLVGFSVDKERSDAVTVTVVLSDEAGNAGSASASLIWDADQLGQQCLTFSEFPPQADGDPMSSVQYVISLVNDSKESEGTVVQVAVY